MSRGVVSGADCVTRVSETSVKVPRSARADRGRVDVDCVCGAVLELRPMHDAKTAPTVMFERSGRASATIPNAWALPAGPDFSCHDTTEACRVCYARRIETARTAFADMVRSNLNAVRHLLDCVGPAETGAMLAVMVDVSAERQRAAGVASPTWRWHADGDIDSAAYAAAIRHCVRATSDVEHWIYTRSPQHLTRLFGRSRPTNLRVLLSADQWNLQRMVRASVRHGGLPLAMLADDPDHARELWDRVDMLDTRGVVPRPIVCPASGASRYGADGRGPAHIVGTDGRRRSLARGELARGACDACRVCLPSGLERSVTFLVHGGGTVRDSVPVTVGRR